MPDLENLSPGDRLELSGDFHVWTHGNGIQLVIDSKTWSIIPIANYGGTPPKIQWEVQDYQKDIPAKARQKFDEFQEAIKYVYQEEQQSPLILTVKQFYNDEVHL